MRSDTPPCLIGNEVSGGSGCTETPLTEFLRIPCAETPKVEFEVPVRSDTPLCLILGNKVSGSSGVQKVH